MAVPKRHHYIPQFLFRRFTEPGNSDRVWMLDKKTGASGRRNPKNECVENYMYSLLYPDGRRDHSAEVELGNIEKTVAELIERLVAVGPQSCTSDDRVTLAFFIILLRLRTPTGRELLREVDESITPAWAAAVLSDPDSVQKRAIESGTEMPLSEIEELRQKTLAALQTGKLRAKSTPSRQTAMMFIGADERATILAERTTWILLRASTGEAFILSDNPVSIVDPVGRGSHRGVGFLSSPHAETTLPLDPACCLLLIPGRSGWGEERIPVSIVGEVNLRAYLGAKRFVYGPSAHSVQSARVNAKEERFRKRELRPRAPIIRTTQI